MDHQDEYHDAMVTLLELIWGEGFMSPGCGLGGPLARRSFATPGDIVLN